MPRQRVIRTPYSANSSTMIPRRGDPSSTISRIPQIFNPAPRNTKDRSLTVPQSPRCSLAICDGRAEKHQWVDQSTMDAAARAAEGDESVFGFGIRAGEGKDLRFMQEGYQLSPTTRPWAHPASGLPNISRACPMAPPLISSPAFTSASRSCAPSSQIPRSNPTKSQTRRIILSKPRPQILDVLKASTRTNPRSLSFPQSPARGSGGLSRAKPKERESRSL